MLGISSKWDRNLHACKHNISSKYFKQRNKKENEKQPKKPNCQRRVATETRCNTSKRIKQTSDHYISTTSISNVKQRKHV